MSFEPCGWYILRCDGSAEVLAGEFESHFPAPARRFERKRGLRLDDRRRTLAPRAVP